MIGGNQKTFISVVNIHVLREVIQKTITVFEAFAGIGAWSKALSRLHIPYQLVGFSEINKYSIDAYCKIHNVNKKLNYGDITDINANSLPQIDLFCASPPCQSFSVAGKQRGMEDERGKLFLDTLRIVTLCKPKVILMENVKGLTFKKFEPELSYILSYLDGLGYLVSYQVLDAKDYGIPQSRKRVFFVCIRKELNLPDYEFPEPVPLEIILRDLLETEVDEKYYIDGKHLIYLNDKGTDQIKKGFIRIDPDIALCQTARQYANWKGNYVTGKSLNCIGYVGGRDSQGSRVYGGDLACTLSAGGGGLGAKTGLYPQNGRIRKLTPLECMRLMNFDDKDYEKINHISDTQIYRLCGNSIVVNVVCKIMKQLFKILK